jgi:phosphate transport system substrate-binding protein
MKRLSLLFIIFISFTASARDYIRIVGSSTLYPFITIASEKYGKISGYTPIVESTGTGGGFNLLCHSKSHRSSPDIVNASRAITPNETKTCANNGIKLKEVKIGLGGIVIAQKENATSINLTEKQLFLALSHTIPYKGKMVDNFYTNWKEIAPDLPNLEILIYGPSSTSGTRDVITELLVKDFGGNIIRQDKHYIEMPEDNNLTIQKLIHNKHAFGIIGLNFLEQNSKIKSIYVNGVQPNNKNIVSGKYPLSRPLFVYVNYSNVNDAKGLKAFVEYLTSDYSIGANGYLTQKGLTSIMNKTR